jgi:hypothetical protein
MSVFSSSRWPRNGPTPNARDNAKTQHDVCDMKLRRHSTAGDPICNPVAAAAASSQQPAPTGRGTGAVRETAGPIEGSGQRLAGSPETKSAVFGMRERQDSVVG